MAGQTIQVSILAETKGIRQGIQQTNGLLDSLKSKVGKTGPVLKGMLGATAITKGFELAGRAVGSLTDVIGESISEAQESAKVGKTTAAIIKATGGAAHVTEGQVGDLATAISNKTGMDDEMIQTGANMLLTFKNVRNEMGKGNDIFNQATAASADLSAAGFGSVDSASKMLGKALNDPIKGVNALSRAGVTFTDQQKAQIKSMQQSGNMLGAQKIILGEVQSQVGGVAEANASAADKFKVMVGNLKEQFGTILLPYLEKAATFFTTTLGPAISKGLEFIGPAIDKIGSLIGPLFSTISSTVKPVIDQIAAFFGGQGGAGGAFNAVAFMGQIEPIKNGILSVFNGLRSVFTTLAPIVVQVITTIISTFRGMAPTIAQIAKQVGENLALIADIIKTVWAKIGPYVLPIVKTVFTTVIGVIKGAVTIIGGVLKVISSILKGDWKGAWDGAKKIVSGVVQVIGSLVKGIGSLVANQFRAMGAVIGEVWSRIKAATSSAWNSIKSAVISGISNVLAQVRQLPGRAVAALGAIGSSLFSAGQDLVRGFINGIGSALGWVADQARSIASTAINAAKNALGIASPSKVFKQIGGFVGQGFIQGLRGTEAQVKSSVSKMVGLLTKEAKQKGKAGAAAKSALKIVNKLDDQALRIAKARLAVTSKLTAAQTKLNDLVKARNDYATDLKHQAVDYASILNIKLDDDMPMTTKDLVQGLKERLAAIVNFRNKIDQLKRQGLNGTTLQQIIAAGVESGTEVLNTLASGGAEALKEVNSLQAQINQQSASLGNNAAGYMYDAGIRAQQGLIAGLMADQKGLQAAADRIAKTLSDAVKKALKIKSPSRVFKEIGNYVTEGLVIGLDTKTTKRAGSVLAGSLVNGFGAPSLQAQALVPGPQSGTQVVQNINVRIEATPGTNRAALGKELNDALNEYKRQGGRLATA